MRNFQQTAATVLLEDFFCTGEGEQVDVCFHGIPGSASCATRLVEQGAFLGTEKAVQADAAEAPVWWELASLRFVHQVGTASQGVPRFQMTRAGVGCFTYGNALLRPTLVCEVRDGLALEECTNLELIVLLRRAGFEWGALPRQLVKRKALFYTVGGE
jgi:hypothetical protein